MCYIAPLIHLHQCARPLCPIILRADLVPVHICRFGYVYHPDQPMQEYGEDDDPFDPMNPHRPCRGVFHTIAESDMPPATITLKSSDWCADCQARLVGDDDFALAEGGFHSEEREFARAMLWSRWADVLRDCDVSRYLNGGTG